MWSSSVSENEQRAAVGDAAKNVQLDLLHRAPQSSSNTFFHQQYATVNGRPCDDRSFISGWLPKDALLAHCDQKYGRGGSDWRGSLSNATEGNPSGVAT